MQSLPKFFCVLIILVFSWAVVGRVQKVNGQSAPDEKWQFAYDLFQMLLEEQGLRVLPKLEQALLKPEESVIVMIGSPPRNFTATDWGNLVSFVQAGGTLLVASESSITALGFGDFVAGPVTTRNALDRYRGFNDCLEISPTIDSAEQFRDITQIVTNRSGWFVPNPIGWFNWDVIAELPTDCLPVAARQQAILAIGRAVGSPSGLAIVSADSSLFSNGMLWHGENALIAIRVSEMLHAGNKRQLVFMTDRQIQGAYRDRIQLSESEAAESREVIEPSLQKALRLTNAVVKEVSDANVLNEALRQQPRKVPPERYFRALLYTIAAALLVGVAWLLVSNRVGQANFLAPRRARAAYEMRGSNAGAASDFRNAAGYLAREFCHELTGSRQTADWQKYLAARMTSNAKQERGELQELTRIIDIACRGCHSKMASQQFQQFGRSLEKLRTKN